MEPAPELATLLERIIATFMNGDATAVIDAVAHQTGSLVIGFDEREWWEGFDKIAAMFRVQTTEAATLGVYPQPRIEHLSAWREGSVGWVAMQMVADSAPSNRAARLTFVLHEEGAYWRIVQWHTSLPVSNEDVFGVTMTTSLDEILVAAQGVDLPAASSRDGAVTIVFTDIEGSTAQMEALGETRWLDLLSWHDDVVRRQTALFGGTVVKNQGDGYMLAFPASGMAAACAVALQRALAPGWSDVAVPVRIGMHSGNAKTEGGDFFGRTVVVAARVGAAAASGEILVTEPVHDDVAAGFTFSPGRSAPLKGLADEYEVFALDWK